MLGRFHRAWPGVTVTILEAESSVQAGRLVLDGIAELGVVHLPAPGRLVLAAELGVQELLFVLPPDAPAGTGPLVPSELATLPLIVTPPGTSTREVLERAFEAAGAALAIAVETTAREAIVPLVLAGAGAALLPAALAHEAGRRGAVVREADPPLSRPIGMIHRVGPLSPAARAFATLAREGIPAS